MWRVRIWKMKIIVGLGNPGGRYLFTRHNVGFVLVDRMKSAMSNYLEWVYDNKSRAETCKIEEKNLVLVKPQTFMNESGVAVAQLVNFYKLKMNDVCVVHDDLDIEMGEYKFQKGKGPKDHKGLISIENHLGKASFWRMRIGVDNRVGTKVEGQEYVLSKFTVLEREILNFVIAEALADLTNFIK